MENQQVTSMIILDLSTTFNMVDHKLLIKVLNHRFGVKDTALEWYKNYLIPRRFKDLQMAHTQVRKPSTSAYPMDLYKEPSSL